MSRWRRALPALALGCALVLIHAGGALAYLSTTGTGSGSTQLATITGPSSVTVSQAGSTVTVSWSAATLSSGTAVQGYTVTRSDGTAICGSATLVTSLSCTDSGVGSGTYTYTVKAVYHSWDATATSAAFTILTAPNLTSEPPSASNSASASFTFTGGGGSYQCKLDAASYGACTSPASYSSLGQGSHTFTVRGANGTSSGPATSYTWTVDTVAPTQNLALASGASGAYVNGTTLYYGGSGAGSFKLTDTVSDGGTGPASAGFPSIATAGWTHAAETVTAPSGGPYTSTTFSWDATPGAPAAYSVTGADAAGNTTATTLTFVNDSAAPTAGALTVNGTAATSGGSSSQATNSTSFTIGSRTDYSDGGSGLQSSVLTVRSESLSGSTCGAPGSGGPFTSAVTLTGTTQPPGIVAGYCYVYTLTGTDNVGNAASISTTVVDNALSFRVTTQVTTATAGVATSGSAIVLTALRNGAVDTTYTGAALTWSGASASPSGATATLPANPTWVAGVATFGITLVDAQAATLTVTDGARSVTFSPITVSVGAAADVAWTSVSSPAGVPSPCLFTCTYASGFGNGQTWSAQVSITDSQGNVVSNVGAGVSVVVTLTGGSIKGSTNPASPATIMIPSSGAAISAVAVQYTSVAHGNYADTLTASSAGDTSATASFSR
jgi:hypothetical protein